MDSLWPAGESSDGPVIATAGLEDPSKLRELLDRAAMLNEDDYYFCVIDQPHDYKFVSPLLRAIERRRLENVSLLLEQEANPDGVPYERQITYARRYRRFCFEDALALRDWEVDVDKEAVGTVASQTEPPYLTDGELTERRTTIAQFWTSPDRIIIDHSQNIAQWHSLVKAGAATPEILDQLLDAGADTTAWRDPISDSLPEEEEELEPSQLCISTPIHAAVAAENRAMVQKLIDSSISPNARALIAGDQALTPVQYAVMLGDLETYTLLLENGADTSICTPVLSVHALHFAVAQLRVDLFDAVRLHSSGPAPVTSMGHTLLHVACLPFNKDQIQRSAPKISQSIHDIRAIAPSPDGAQDWPPPTTTLAKKTSNCPHNTGRYVSREVLARGKIQSRPGNGPETPRKITQGRKPCADSSSLLLETVRRSRIRISMATTCSITLPQFDILTSLS